MEAENDSSRSGVRNTLPKPTLYIDILYNNLAELSTLLAGHDIPKSPDGWVRLSTLKSYDGVDVMGNRHPTSQDIVASNTFSVTCGGNLQNLDKTIIETLVARDHARSYGRFQLGYYALDDGHGGHGRKELLIRLSPSAQIASRFSRHQGTADTLPPFGAYFCNECQYCRTVRKDGINPRARSLDSLALKLHGQLHLSGGS